MFALSKWIDEQRVERQAVSGDLRASPIEYGLIAALLALTIIMSAATTRTQIASTFNHSSPSHLATRSPLLPALPTSLK